MKRPTLYARDLPSLRKTQVIPPAVLAELLAVCEERETLRSREIETLALDVEWDEIEVRS